MVFLSVETIGLVGRASGLVCRLRRSAWWVMPVVFLSVETIGQVSRASGLVCRLR